MELIASHIYYILGFLALLAGLIFQKSKIASVFILIFLFILAGWSYGNADYNGYAGLFYCSPNDPNIEIGFQYLNYFFRTIGLSYRELLIFISASILGINYFFISSKTKYVAIILALYFIYPFPMEVTQIRFALAVAVIYIGFYFLFNKKNWGVLLFILFTIIAIFIHTSTFVFLICALTSKLKTKYSLVVSIIICLLIGVIIGNWNFFNAILTNINIFNLGNIISKIQFVNSITGSNINIFYASISYLMCLIFLAYLYIYCCLKKYVSLGKINIYNDKINYINICFKITFSFLIIYPLFNISIDFYRLIQALTVLNLTGVSQFLDITDKFKNKNIIDCKLFNYYRIPIYITMFLLVILETKFWLTDTGNYYYVTFPLFENNQFIEWIKALFGIA